MNKIIAIILSLSGSLVFANPSAPTTKPAVAAAPQPSQAPPTTVSPAPSTPATAPVAEAKKQIKFDSEFAYKQIEKQIAFGPRVVGSPAHKKMADALVEDLKSLKLEVTEQILPIKTPKNGEKTARNIIARYLPKTKKRIILSAHYDSRPYADQESKPSLKTKPVPGANDGASGVGILLSIARDISSINSTLGVDFIFWDAEDLGVAEVQDSFCLGTQAWAAKMPYDKETKPIYGINLDMVGGKNAAFSREGFSLFYAPEIVDKVWKAAKKVGAEKIFLETNDSPIIDDHYYVNAKAKIKMIDIIQKDMSTGGFFKEWHTTKDDMSVISKDTLQKVGDTLIEVIRNEQ